MTLFNTRPSVEKPLKNEPALTEEARLHGRFSSLAAAYVRLIKDSVLNKIDFGDVYSIRDFQVLLSTFETYKPVTASHIFKSTGLDPATVTRSVKTLVANGHLRVSENEQDSRSRYLHVTEQGKSLAIAYCQACNNLFLSDGFSMPNPSDPELKSLHSMLRRLNQRVKILRLKNFN